MEELLQFKCQFIQPTNYSYTRLIEMWEQETFKILDIDTYNDFCCWLQNNQYMGYFHVENGNILYNKQVFVGKVDL